MNRQELIELWRSREVKETAALVVEDKALQKVLAAWPTVPLRRMADDAAESRNADGAESWDALWQTVHVDLAEVATLCGLQPGPAVLAFNRARALRLIYPDGTLHAVAKVVLQKRIRDAVTKGAR